MAARWNHEQLSAILSSTRPGLNRASVDPLFPSLSRADEEAICDVDPSSTEGRILCTFQDLLTHRINPRAAADILGSLTSAHCSSSTPHDASILWGAICHRGETWPEAELRILADLVVELARLSHPLPEYPYDTDEPVQGTSSFVDLPGFGQELVGYLQGMDMNNHRAENAQKLTVLGPGPKCYSLQFMNPEARKDATLRTAESMTERIVSGDVVLAVRDLYKNINTFAALLSCYHIRGALPQDNVDFRGMACYPIVGALEHELSLNEVTQHSDGSATIPDQNWAAFRSSQPSIDLPAATQWLSILGHDLYDRLMDFVAPVGPLWKAQGGEEKITVERWRFWQNRLRYFASNDTILGDGIKTACRQAADHMDKTA
ncbi:hypothetical protein J4E81_000131 [Alternaria sp. BMP 2799]|uniref:uncharacterized protein n=1 Tax=Alternaria viburni TaxID=566460 RepID=UPI0020C34445|nr:uncharacterized protein J4E79_004805 [Alternaria viburni]KAI4662515.1 hypothetical protein J4E79_004805 [Alternaria viburni]KAI4705251.1 hypothetical protein J4E81_000131 [Alternaria sp. BMP 2799]KAI4711841.1 hypothetical protein J4E89_003284 [Alternaria sp. Ai002NY15]